MDVHKQYISGSYDQSSMEAAKHIEGIVSKTMFKIYSTNEDIYTAQICSELNRYLSDLGVCCLHQLSLKKKSRPDIYVTALDDYEISEVPKLVADYKVKDFEKAVDELFSFT